MPTMRTPRRSRIHRLRKQQSSTLQMRPMQSLSGPLPLHNTRSQNDLYMPVWRQRCRITGSRGGSSRRLDALFEEGFSQPTQPGFGLRWGLGGKLQSWLHGFSLQGWGPWAALALNITHFWGFFHVACALFNFIMSFYSIVACQGDAGIFPVKSYFTSIMRTVVLGLITVSRLFA